MLSLTADQATGVGFLAEDSSQQARCKIRTYIRIVKM